MFKNKIDKYLAIRRAIHRISAGKLRIVRVDSR